MGRKTKWKRVENTSDVKLTPTQSETLYYLTEEFLSISKISNIQRRGQKAIYKTISQLKKKGVLTHTEKNHYIKRGKYSVTTPSDKTYRLHRTHFEIKILEKSSKFYDLYENKNIKDVLDNNTITLCRDKILVYMKKDFFGDNVDECEREMLDYLFRFITQLENKFKVLLRKDRKLRVYQFAGEIARVNDNIAKKYVLEDKQLHIRDDKGRLRLIVDRSSPYGIKWSELEAVNKDFHTDDMRKVDYFLKDLITKDTLVLSEVSSHIKSLQYGQNISSERFDKIEKMLEQVLEVQNTNALLVMKLSKDLDNIK